MSRWRNATSVPLLKGGLFRIDAVQNKLPSPIHHGRLNHLIIRDTGVRFQDERQGKHRRGRLSAALALPFDTDSPAPPGMAHQTRYAGIGAGTQTIWPSVSVSQSVPPVSKTLQVVANVMVASVLPLLLGLSRRTAVKAKGRSGSTSPIGPTYRSCLFFPRAQTPSRREMEIIQTARASSTTAPPEEPTPMAHDPKAEQGDQHENTDQEQRHWNRIAVSRRGCERERLGIDRWISEIHHQPG
jgi:hypothetical protein